MACFLTFAIVAYLLPLIGATELEARNATACTPVHLFLARGTTEDYPGTLGSLADMVVDAVSGGEYENIIYPATDESSTSSYFEGRQAVAQQLNAYVAKCPLSKIALLGYSQGAMIIGDALAGGGGDPSGVLGKATAPTISPELGSHVTAVSFYGDPRHVPYRLFDIGNSTFNVTGKYPRTTGQISVIDALYSSKVHDYCNEGDPVCASGDNLQAHLEYSEKWDTIASSWLVSMLQ